MLEYVKFIVWVVRVFARGRAVESEEFVILDEFCNWLIGQVVGGIEIVVTAKSVHFKVIRPLGRCKDLA